MVYTTQWLYPIPVWKLTGISMGLMWACFRVWYPNGFVFFTILVSVWVQIFLGRHTPTHFQGKWQMNGDKYLHIIVLIWGITARKYKKKLDRFYESKHHLYHMILSKQIRTHESLLSKHVRSARKALHSACKTGASGSAALFIAQSHMFRSTPCPSVCVTNSTQARREKFFFACFLKT